MKARSSSWFGRLRGAADFVVDAVSPLLAEGSGFSCSISGFWVLSAGVLLFLGCAGVGVEGAAVRHLFLEVFTL